MSDLENLTREQTKEVAGLLVQHDALIGVVIRQLTLPASEISYLLERGDRCRELLSAMGYKCVKKDKG